jgi:hypothetical protein
MHAEYLWLDVNERQVELLIVLVVGVFSKHILGEEIQEADNIKIISAFTKQCNW